MVNKYGSLIPQKNSDFNLPDLNSLKLVEYRSLDIYLTKPL